MYIIPPSTRSMINSPVGSTCARGMHKLKVTVTSIFFPETFIFNQ